MSGIPEPASAFEKADDVKNSNGATVAGSNGATADRDEQGRFLTGRKGGPGRRKGSRVKLVEDVVTDVLDSWRQHGPIVLERLACLDPGKYADFIAKVLPREVKIEHTTFTDGMSDEQLERMLEIAERFAAGAVIEGSMRNVTPPPFSIAPPTEAAQRAEALRRDMIDQHDALRAVEPVIPAPTSPLPHPVGRAVPVSARDEERRNIAKLHDDNEVDPATLF